MNVTLYNITPDKYKLNKLITNLTPKVTFDCILKDGTSLYNPTLIIQANQDVDMGKLVTYHYAYMSTLGRYYYVENRIFLANNFVELMLKVDVLYSFMSDIKNATLPINRSASSVYFNGFIPDNALMFETRDTIEVSEGSTLRTPSNAIDTEFITAKDKYNVVADVITSQTNDVNNDDTFDAPSVLERDGAIDLTLKEQRKFQMLFNQFYCLNSNTNIVAFMNEIINDEEKASYVKSLIVYPFEIPCNASDVGTILLGENKSINVTCRKIKESSMKAYVIEDITIPSPNNFMDYEPYVKYQMWIPYDKWIDLTPSDVVGCRLIVYYIPHLTSSNGSVFVYNYTKKTMIYQNDIQIGIQIGISYSNQTQIDSKGLQNAISSAFTGLASGVTAIIGGITLNPIMLVGGILGATASMGNMIAQQANLYSSAKSSVTTGLSGTFNPQKVYIKKIYKKCINSVDEFYEQRGRPTNKMIQLNNVSGFTSVIIANGFSSPNATDYENEEIRKLLIEGIYV